MSRSRYVALSRERAQAVARREELERERNQAPDADADAASTVDTDLFAFTATAGEVIFLGLDGDPLRDNTPRNFALALLDSGNAQIDFGEIVDADGGRDGFAARQSCSVICYIFHSFKRFLTGR